MKELLLNAMVWVESSAFERRVCVCARAHAHVLTHAHHTHTHATYTRKYRYGLVVCGDIAVYEVRVRAFAGGGDGCTCLSLRAAELALCKSFRGGWYVYMM